MKYLLIIIALTGCASGVINKKEGFIRQCTFQTAQNEECRKLAELIKDQL